MNMSKQATMINIIYDLIAGNPTKGVYDLSHSQIKNMIYEVDSDSKTIYLRDSKSTYELILMKGNNYENNY